MKKHLLLLSLVFFVLASCKKTTPFDPVKQAATDDANIKAYLAAHPSINATKDPSGLYYQIIAPGTGANPSVNSTVTVNYTGKLLDGSTFDSGTISNPLSGLIKGWQIGVPYVKTGGRILLIVPSALGYGNSSPGAGIPANSVLIFTIDLTGFSG